jgi:hypothetical protein
MSRLNNAFWASLASLTVGVALLLAQPVAADDEYPAPGFFLDGLTAESAWRQILAKPGVTPEVPFIPFEATYVALDSVCVDGPLLGMENPRVDNSARISANTLRAQAAAALAGAEITPSGPQLAAATPTDPPRQVALLYPVRVFKVIERAPNPVRIYLFEKVWPVPVCSTR